MGLEVVKSVTPVSDTSCHQYMRRHSNKAVTRQHGSMYKPQHRRMAAGKACGVAV